MKKVVIVILAVGFMVVLTSCQTQHNCPNYGQLETEQSNA